jgi:hypothetical protein
MGFNLSSAIEILDRSPALLEVWLRELPVEWTEVNEGPGTWSVYDIIGHLIHGEKTDWIPRMKIILSGEGEKKFEVFDRFAQFKESKGKLLVELLTEFRQLRRQNLKLLLSFNLTGSDLSRTGIHPEFGEVSLRQLLSAWVVHDLNHLAQIARVMAFQYKEDTGPWYRYLRIINH